MNEFLLKLDAFIEQYKQDAKHPRFKQPFTWVVRDLEELKALYERVHVMPIINSLAVTLSEDIRRVEGVRRPIAEAGVMDEIVRPKGWRGDPKLHSHPDDDETCEKCKGEEKEKQ